MLCIYHLKYILSTWTIILTGHYLFPCFFFVLFFTTNEVEESLS